MPRSLFDDMVNKKISQTPVAPRMIQAASLNTNAPVPEAATPKDYRNIGQKFADTLRTPITPSATLNLAQFAAAVSREGSWQSRLAQTVAGQEQQKINTSYVQDVLSGKEPTPQEIKGVPLEVQLGARKQVQGEQAQQFSQEQRTYEFDVRQQLEKIGKMIELQRVDVQKSAHELDVSKFSEAQKEFDKQFSNRKKYSSLGGVGVYNQETGQFIISKALVDAKLKLLHSSVSDQTWQRMQGIGKEARARGKQALYNQGLVLFNDAGQVTKIVGNPTKINEVYNEAYKEYVTRNFGSDPGQLPFTDEQIKWLSEADFAKDFAIDENGKKIDPDAVVVPTDSTATGNPFTK